MAGECAWSPCFQEPVGGGELCYFHRKRAEGLIAGIIPGPGLSSYSEPSARVKKLINEIYDNEKEDSK